MPTRPADPARARERALARELRRKKRRIDQPMCDRARHLAQYYPLQEVAAALGVAPSQITRMKKCGWQAKTETGRFRSMPADFAERSRTSTHAQLVQHYRAGNHTVIRWMRELGLGARPSWRGDNLRREQNNPAAVKVSRDQREISARVRKAWSTRKARIAAESRQINIDDAIASRRSGGAPEAAPLPDPDAPAVAAADVSAPKAAQSRQHARGRQPEHADA